MGQRCLSGVTIPDRITEILMTSSLTEHLRSRRFDLLFFAACLAFLCLHLFQLPATPIFYEGDHVKLLEISRRVALGEVLYRDVFDLVFPGSVAVYAFLIKIFGREFWLVNAVIILHGMASAALGLAISRRLIANKVIAYLPPAIFIFFGFRWFGLDGEHRMISPLFLYGALLILLRSRSLVSVAAAGSLCALASFFTQQRGLLALAAIGLFLLIEQGFVGRNVAKLFKSWTVLTAAFFAVLVVLVSPFVYQAGLDRFLNDTIFFITSYSQDPNNNSLYSFFHTIEKIRGLGMVMTVVTVFYSMIVPVSYAAAFGYVAFKSRRVGFATYAGITLVCLTGLFLALGTTGPNAMRLFQVSMPALIASCWVVERVGGLGKRMAGLVLIGLMVAGIVLGIRTQSAWEGRTLETESGRLVFLSPVISERYEWLLQNAKPGDLVFETYSSHVNFPLGLRNPSRMSITLNSGYSPPEHVSQVIEDLKREQPRYIIWDGSWTAEMPQLAEGEKLKPLFEYMIQNYSRVAEFTPYDGREREIWERAAEAVERR